MMSKEMKKNVGGRRSIATYVLFLLFFGFPWVAAQAGDEAKIQIIGEWQSARSHFGSDSWDNCILAIEPEHISYKGVDLSKIEYEIILHEEHTIILKVVAGDSRCYLSKDPTYWRFDNVDFHRCLLSHVADDCPRPFSFNKNGDLKFELSIFPSENAARNYGVGLRYWSGDYINKDRRVH